MKAKAAAIATDLDSTAAAEELLAAKGSAADAVVAAYFSMAARSPGVLLAPAIALVGGAGAGARAFDGRAMQPGAGAARPRGTVPGETPPHQARAAAPRAPHMAILLHASHGRRSLRELTKGAAAAAREAGARRRGDLLAQLGEGGMPALGRASVAEPLLAAASANVGGLLTADDLAGARADDQPARVSGKAAELRVVSEPWPSAGEARVSAVAAVDAWGLVAVLATFQTEQPGVAVPELEIELPAVAEPVRRGKTRVAPRTILPVPARVALVDAGAALRAAIVFDGDPGDGPSLADGLAPATWLAGWGASIAALAESGSARPWRRQE